MLHLSLVVIVELLRFFFADGEMPAYFSPITFRVMI